MLRKLRKATIEKCKDLEDFLNAKSQPYYIEKNYKNIKLFKYLLFLRKNGANLNKFFDEEIKNSKK